MLNTASRSSRALCAVVPLESGLRGSTALQRRLTAIPSLPEPFKSDMTDGEIEVELSRPEVKNVLDQKMKQSIHSDAPMPLKRIGVMAFYDFARKPWDTDTVPVDEYAARFNRFVDSWISSPSQHEFEETCPTNEAR